jgi:glycosyltransferase involved in cell wall biosynthesis
VSGSATEETGIEVSVVMPCLNEALTVGVCVARAVEALDVSGIVGEVVVADNGSSDGSQRIAADAGARVIPVLVRGYGSALLGGIQGARGRYVVMGDADNSYDFAELPRFVDKLREGYDLVQGCRLRAGGGRVAPGAMPPLHRWLGNPMFSWLARVWFRAPVHDVHCGMRGFRRTLVRDLDLRCTGMEFASEMIIRAALRRVRVDEVPITLHQDGRGGRAPHLRTFRDGWRHLRFYLLYSPRWLFLAPGAVLAAIGALAYLLALPATVIAGVGFDVHTLLFGSVAVVCGYQAVLFGVLAKVFAVTTGLLPIDPRVERAFRVANLERGLLAGAAVLGLGILLLLAVTVAWWQVDFGALDYRATMRLAIPGAMLTVLGVQTVLFSFFFSILGLPRR